MIDSLQKQQQSHASKIADQKEQLRKLLDENRRMKESRTSYDRQIFELEGQLKRLNETEGLLSAEWQQSMQEMEEKVATMKNTVSATVEQLRENLKLLNQYKVKV